MTFYSDLGPYGDLVQVCNEAMPLFPERPATRQDVRSILGFQQASEQPQEVRLLGTWTHGDIAGEELSWSVGYGPPTHAWLLKPVAALGPAPGVVALYDHGHFKFYGKEKIADGPDGLLAAVAPFRAAYYSGRAYANELARAGFAVLVHDTFLWGSRKFPLAAMPEIDRALANQAGAMLGHGDIDPAILHYHGAAYLHENQIAKYCNLLGTTIAAITAHEDRVALNYLASRPDVDPQRLGCIGFSGGGLRAAILGATADSLKARVVSGMMSTYAEMLDRHVTPHTWMLFPAGWSRYGDLADLAGCAAPAPLFVQYALGDALFTPKGMRDADERIRSYYGRAGMPDAYRSDFHDGPHRFDREMQDRAFAWLRETLAAN